MAGGSDTHVGKGELIGALAQLLHEADSQAEQRKLDLPGGIVDHYRADRHGALFALAGKLGLSESLQLVYEGQLAPVTNHDQQV